MIPALRLKQTIYPLPSWCRISGKFSVVDGATTNLIEAGHRLWILRLVPSGARGRWWCAGLMLLVLLAFFGLTGALQNTESSPSALFFCAILAYITPIFRYVTERTEAAFDELAAHLTMDAASVARLRRGLSSKSTKWYLLNTTSGIAVWVLQSRVLVGSFEEMVGAISGSSIGFAMSVGPLLVWIFMFCAIHALVDNARIFRELAGAVQLDLLDSSPVTPFGRMAVTSTLVVIGSQALFPIMWLGGDNNPWTSIPGLLLTSLALFYPFFAVVWPLHQRIRATKREELARLANELRVRRAVSENPALDPALSPLLVYRREIASAPEWPFDISIVARFGLYLVIVPLTWIGAALIENVVDLFIRA
jgi:hypothetical protein